MIFYNTGNEKTQWMIVYNKVGTTKTQTKKVH